MNALASGMYGPRSSSPHLVVATVSPTWFVLDSYRSACFVRQELPADAVASPPFGHVWPLLCLTSPCCRNRVSDLVCPGLVPICVLCAPGAACGCSSVASFGRVWPLLFLTSPCCRNRVSALCAEFILLGLRGPGCALMHQICDKVVISKFITFFAVATNSEQLFLIGNSSGHPSATVCCRNRFATRLLFLQSIPIFVVATDSTHLFLGMVVGIRISNSVLSQQVRNKAAIFTVHTNLCGRY